VGAGAPDCLKFSERLFKFPSIGALRDEKDAMAAIVNPAKQEGFESAAVQQILTVTERYPLFAAVGARSLEHCQQKFYSSKDVLEAHNSALSASWTKASLRFASIAVLHRKKVHARACELRKWIASFGRHCVPAEGKDRQCGTYTLQSHQKRNDLLAIAWRYRVYGAALRSIQDRAR